MNLRKKEVDIEKVKQFSQWFFRNEERIRNSVENRQNDRVTTMSELDEVEDELAKVYRDGYAGTIEFDYGGKADEWNLNLYHKNNKFLMQATAMIAQEMNATKNQLWTVFTEK